MATILITVDPATAAAPPEYAYQTIDGRIVGETFAATYKEEFLARLEAFRRTVEADPRNSTCNPTTAATAAFIYHQPKKGRR